MMTSFSLLNIEVAKGVLKVYRIVGSECVVQRRESDEKSCRQVEANRLLCRVVMGDLERDERKKGGRREGQTRGMERLSRRLHAARGTRQGQDRTGQDRGKDVPKWRREGEVAWMHSV